MVSSLGFLFLTLESPSESPATRWWSGARGCGTGHWSYARRPPYPHFEELEVFEVLSLIAVELRLSQKISLELEGSRFTTTQTLADTYTGSVTTVQGTSTTSTSALPLWHVCLGMRICALSHSAAASRKQMLHSASHKTRRSQAILSRCASAHCHTCFVHESCLIPTPSRKQ